MRYPEIHSCAELTAFIDEIGFLPLLRMGVDSWSAEELVDEDCQYTPMPVGEQIAVLYCGTHGLLRDVPLEHVSDFERLLIEALKPTGVFDTLVSGGLTDDACRTIEKAAEEVAASLKIS